MRSDLRLADTIWENECNNKYINHIMHEHPTFFFPLEWGQSTQRDGDRISKNHHYCQKKFSNKLIT